jgi:hypothetical protein
MSIGSRYLNQYQYTLEKDTVTLYGSYTVDGYGVVATYQGGGIASVEQTATGNYDVTLQDGWDYLFNVNATVYDSATTAVASVQVKDTYADAQTAIKNTTPIHLQLLNFAGAAVNPAVTATVAIEIRARRTSVGPFDAGTTV